MVATSGEVGSILEYEMDTGDTLPMIVSEALELVGGDEGFLEEILTLYREEFSEQFKRLEEALGGEDFDAIRAIGHSLKGSSSNLTMPPLTEVTYAIERAGEERDIDRARVLIDDLDREFKRLIAWLRER